MIKNKFYYFIQPAINSQRNLPASHINIILKTSVNKIQFYQKIKTFCFVLIFYSQKFTEFVYLFILFGTQNPDSMRNIIDRVKKKRYLIKVNTKHFIEKMCLLKVNILI